MTIQVGYESRTGSGKTFAWWPSLEVVGVALVALLMVVAGAAGFVMVVVGIRSSERRTGLPGPVQGRADAFARLVLDAKVAPVPVMSLRDAQLAMARRSAR